MLIRAKPICFTGLGHYIADINLGRFALQHRFPDFRNKEITDDAGIQASRSQNQNIGLPDRFYRALCGGNILRYHVQPLNRLVRLGNFGLPQNVRAIGHIGRQLNIMERGRNHMAADFQDLAGRVQPLYHAAFRFRDGRQEKIPQTMPGKIGIPLEPVLHDTFHQRFAVCHRHHAFAQIARRDDPQFVAKPPG